MAKVVFVGLEESTARQIGSALGAQRHEIEYKPREVFLRDTLEADIVFAGGDSSEYLPLLKRTREISPALPFVVVSRTPEVMQWLDALEAGATDYCAAPFETRHMHWLMESALSGRAPAAC